MGFQSFMYGFTCVWIRPTDTNIALEFQDHASHVFKELYNIGPYCNFFKLIH